jgi:hypothetical protein
LVNRIELETVDREMNKPSPEQYVVQRAFYWRETEKKMIASNGDKAAKSAHRDATRKLGEAVDIAARKMTCPS